MTAVAATMTRDERQRLIDTHRAEMERHGRLALHHGSPILAARHRVKAIEHQKAIARLVAERPADEVAQIENERGLR